MLEIKTDRCGWNVPYLMPSNHHIAAAVLSVFAVVEENITVRCWHDIRLLFIRYTFYSDNIKFSGWLLYFFVSFDNDWLLTRVAVLVFFKVHIMISQSYKYFSVYSRSKWKVSFFPLTGVICKSKDFLIFFHVACSASRGESHIFLANRPDGVSCVFSICLLMLLLLLLLLLFFFLVLFSEEKIKM